MTGGPLIERVTYVCTRYRLSALTCHPKSLYAHAKIREPQDTAPQLSDACPACWQPKQSAYWRIPADTMQFGLLLSLPPQSHCRSFATLCLQSSPVLQSILCREVYRSSALRSILIVSQQEGLLRCLEACATACVVMHPQCMVNAGRCVKQTC